MFKRRRTWRNLRPATRVFLVPVYRLYQFIGCTSLSVVQTKLDEYATREPTFVLGSNSNLGL